MSSFSKPGGTRTGLREQPDLRQQYRRIGIGAVAAALSVTTKDAGKNAVRDDRAKTQEEWYRYAESTAA